MTNPVFSNNAVFGEPRRGRGAVVQPQHGQAQYGQQQYGQYGQQYGAPQAGAGVPATGYSAQNLEQMYGAPPATTRETGRLTYDDVIVKTGGLLALLVVVGAAAWAFAPGLWLPAMIVGFVLALVIIFKREPSPALIIAYAAVEGVFLGGISRYFETAYSGVVLQAVLATVATFAVALMLYRSGKVRVTRKSVRFFMIAAGGYLLFSLINFGLVAFNVLDGWGLREGPFGLLIGLFAVGLATFSLILDFDGIKRGVEQGAPAKFAWTAAFGLIVTLVWLYLEFLRILAILRGD